MAVKAKTAGAKRKSLGKIQTGAGTLLISKRGRMPEFTADSLRKLGVTIYPRKKK